MCRHPETAELQQWVAKGKLQWLDLSSPDLPLLAGPAEAFPYRGISGYGHRFVYRPKPVVEAKPWWAFWRKRKLLEGGKVELF